MRRRMEDMSGVEDGVVRKVKIDDLKTNLQFVNWTHLKEVISNKKAFYKALLQIDFLFNQENYVALGKCQDTLSFITSVKFNCFNGQFDWDKNLSNRMKLNLL